MLCGVLAEPAVVPQDTKIYKRLGVGGQSCGATIPSKCQPQPLLVGGDLLEMPQVAHFFLRHFKTACRTEAQSMLFFWEGCHGPKDHPIIHNNLAAKTSMMPKRCKHQVLTRLCSKVIVQFLTVITKNGYTGEFEITDDHRAGKIVVNLMGRLNKCGVISPRFDVQLKDLKKWQIAHLVSLY
eukprot:bmy_03815T0